jgi:hypothetical protein
MHAKPTNSNADQSEELGQECEETGQTVRFKSFPTTGAVLIVWPISRNQCITLVESCCFLKEYIPVTGFIITVL